MPVISSISNPRVAQARKLHRKSHRDDTGHFLIEGCRAVATALRSPGGVVDILLEDGAPCADEIRSLAGDRGVQITEVTDRVLKAAADTTTPQGVVAVAARPALTVDEVVSGATLVLIIAGVSDPGNGGTLIRSAIAAGCDAVIFTGGAVDPFGPKTVRASAGMVFEIPIVATQDVAAVFDATRGQGLRVIGAAPEAATAMTDLDLTSPVALVVGNEAWGLKPEHQRMLDDVASIPMPGPAESLNVGVAGAVLLFEAVRQRRSVAG
jgi:RNA methyltransferase, TrmH family